MSSRWANRNLLFGVLALQLDLLGRDALVAGLNAWATDKSRPLGDVLQDRGDLDSGRRALIESLVAEHLQAHANDPGQSLAALSSPTLTWGDLAHMVADPDIQASLVSTAVPAVVPAVGTTILQVAPPAPQPGPPQPPKPGQAERPVPRYRILRPHARGSLGEVFVAEDTELHREVALKEIQRQRADDSDSRSRFIVEAEITGSLEHPGIVPVYGLGQYGDGRPFYAMRLIKGDNFRDAIERFHAPQAHALQRAGFDTFDFRQLLGRFVDVCQAVAFAHNRGVLHRDLKPSNVMLGPYGETLVVDWGLAKAVGVADPSSHEAPLQPSSGSGVVATIAGGIVGTPAYMSPEQAAGQVEGLRPATDIYALGGILFTLLTGRPPLSGTALEVLDKVQRGRLKRPREVMPAIPTALEAICLKAMALDPDDRYRSALDVAADVEHWLADEPVSAHREPAGVRVRRWVKRHRTAVTAMAVLLVTAVIGLAAGLTAVGREQRRTAAERDVALDQKRRTRQALDAMTSQVTADWLATQRELLPEQRQFLLQALDYYRDFAVEHSGGPSQATEMVGAYDRVGLIYDKLGRTAEAADAYRRALELLGPDGPRLDRAKLHRRLGVLLRAPGPIADAETHLKTAADLFRDGGPPEALGQTLADLAVVIDRQGRNADAEAVYREAIQLLGQWAAEHPEQAEARFNLAGAETNLAALLRRMSRVPDAEAGYRRAAGLMAKLVEEAPGKPDYRRTLSVIEADLGALLTSRFRLAEAVEAFRRAGDLLTRLVEDYPGVPDYRRELARCRNNEGLLMRQLRKPAEAEAAFGKAVEQFEKLAAAEPGAVNHAVALGIASFNLGALAQTRGDREAAVRHYDRAIKALGPAVERDPKRAEAKTALKNSSASRALALGQLGRHAEALADWDRCLSLSTPAERPGWRVLRATTLAKAGRVDEAVAEADALAASGSASTDDLYNAACVLSLASAAEAGRREEYASRAVELLRRAVSKGYKDGAGMQADDDLDPLRRREDFQRLLSELVPAGPPKPPAKPMR